MEPYQNKKNTTTQRKPQRIHKTNQKKKESPPLALCSVRVWGALSCGCAPPPALLSAMVWGYGVGEASRNSTLALAYRHSSHLRDSTVAASPTSLFWSTLCGTAEGSEVQTAPGGISKGATFSCSSAARRLGCAKTLIMMILMGGVAVLATSPRLLLCTHYTCEGAKASERFEGGEENKEGTSPDPEAIRTKPQRQPTALLGMHYINLGLWVRDSH